MLELDTVYKNHNERFAQNNVCHSYNAAVLVFPFKLSKTADWTVPAEPEDDMIGRRMNAPLHSHEMTAVLDMIKHRAKHLGQAIWITTGTFLTAMGIEDLEDLRRCDFVRAVEYLMPSVVSAQTQNVT